jgi:hypothetical protein
MGKIEFTMKNLKKCVCSTCPCQADSACAKDKLMKMQEAIQKNEMPESDVVPGMYCALGKTACTDLDFDRFCQCNYCDVWKENNLENGKPFGYFCKNGEAI